MDIKYNIEEKKDAYVTASITIPYGDFKKEYEKILKSEADKVDVKGFRKGSVPVDMLDPQTKSMGLIQALENLTPKYLSEIIEKEGLKLLAPPQYLDLPNFEKEEDLNLKIKFTVFPEVKIGDLKKIKVKKEDSKPTKEEIKNTLDEMFKRSTVKEKGKEPSDKWAEETGKLYELKNVKNLNDLNKEIENLLTREKERIVKQNQEHDILEQAISLSNLDIPDEAIDFEAQEREKSFLQELKNSNISVDDFCKSRDVKFEDLRESWKKDSKEALEGELFLKSYAQEKKIDISEDELNKNIDEIKQNQQQEIPDSLINDERWRENIRNITKKQKAYKDLISSVLK